VDPELLDRPSSVRRGPDGALYVATFHNSGVTRLDDGGATRFFADSYLEEPVELAFHGDRLFVLGNDTANVVVADADGAFLDEFGYPEMRNAHDMAFGPDGLLYVATSVSIALEAGLQAWDVDQRQLVDAFAPEDEVGRATAVAFDAEGDLYVADGMHGRVLRYDLASRALAEVVIDEGLDQPVSLDLSTDGALYVADRLGVHRFDATSGAPLGNLADEVERPRGVTVVTRPRARP
jgi:sugar lactone lactonase YvrE